MQDFISGFRDRALALMGGQPCPVLLAVSGGIDSVVLAHLWKMAGWSFEIAHCNFNLRGEESEGDEAFLRRLATEMGVRIHVRSFNTRAEAEQAKLSIQATARALRYDWFEGLLNEQHLDWIVTAHNRNDHVETALFHFFRGTGIRGMTGIPEQNGRVIRPLLFASRADIETYARQNKLAWREDSSNDSDQYSRNFIRNRILPLAAEMFPGVLDQAAATTERLSDYYDNSEFLRRAYLDRIGEFDDGAMRYQKSGLLALPAPEAMLFEILYPLGFTAEEVRQVSVHLDDTGLELASPKGYRVMVERDHLVVSSEPRRPNRRMPVEADDLLVTLPDGSRLALHPSLPNEPFGDGRSFITVDAMRLKFPLTIRNWQDGDAFQPLGMGGRQQKLQDFFTNLKLGKLEKEKTWILTNRTGEIIWIVGYRPDERFKVTNHTSQCYKIAWIN